VEAEEAEAAGDVELKELDCDVTLSTTSRSVASSQAPMTSIAVTAFPDLFVT
jgi:hypothetical protein